MWIWNCTVSNEDVQRAEAKVIGYKVTVMESVASEDRAIAQAAVNAFFAPEHLGKISQSEYVDDIESITPVEGGYDVKCIIRGD